MNRRVTFAVATILASTSFIATAGAANAAKKPTSKTDNPPIAALNVGNGQFVEMAGAAGVAEIAAGKLALERSSRADVKEFAQKVIADHEAARTELSKIVTAKGMALPTEATPEDQKLLAELATVTGPAFDELYLREAGVNAHEKAVALFEGGAKTGDAELRAFAEKTLPTLQKHLTMARGLAAPVAASLN
ncbi:MAG: DUF4142 domain-containing protein [Thermoanaerobaculia bacterium]